MKKFKKGDSEYQSNGHYLINGIDYMSIYTFKNKHDIKPNSNSSNGDEGIELFNNGVESFDSVPDFGNFDSVLLYPLTELEKFYQV